MPSDQPKTTKIALRVNQTWKPTNGKRARQILDIRESILYDREMIDGPVLILWATTADRNGACSEKAFRTWIQRNGAELQVGIQ